ncbi:hypothetical protein BDW62DRAFT_196572 [Aspergillus aurantiobrunneus]
MVVVSASDWTTQRAYFSNYSPGITTFAPGHNIQCPKDPARADTGTRTMEACSGTSFAAPQVAALASYYRAVTSPWRSQLSNTSNVKKLIQLFARRFAVRYPANTPDDQKAKPKDRRPIIWNGQVGEHSCLSEYWSTENWAKVCPTINDNLADEPASLRRRR